MNREDIKMLNHVYKLTIDTVNSHDNVLSKTEIKLINGIVEEFYKEVLKRGIAIK